MLPFRAARASLGTGDCTFRGTTGRHHQDCVSHTEVSQQRASNSSAGPPEKGCLWTMDGRHWDLLSLVRLQLPFSPWQSDIECCVCKAIGISFQISVARTAQRVMFRGVRRADKELVSLLEGLSRVKTPQEKVQ